MRRLSVACALAFACHPLIAEAQARTQVELRGILSFPDGSSGGGSVTLALIDTPTVLYVSSPKNMCEARSASPTRPTDAAYGWRIDLAREPIAATDVIAVKAQWRRLGSGGDSTSPSRSEILLLKPGATLILDSLPNVPGAARDTILEYDQARAAEIKTQIDTLNREEHLGSRHPKVMFAQADLDKVTADAAARAKLLSEAPPAVNCSALNLALALSRPAAESTSGFEAEAWLVRKDGERESSQRQTVRTSGAEAQIIFDPEVTLAAAGVTKHFVSCRLTGVSYQNGTIKADLKIERSWMGGPGGWAVYPISMSPGEVLSFQLGKMGSAAESQFSVRLRINILNVR